jgi:hypothetical protein
MQLGWVVRLVLSTPPGPPRGWAVRGRAVPVPHSLALAPFGRGNSRRGMGLGFVRGRPGGTRLAARSRELELLVGR